LSVVVALRAHTDTLVRRLPEPAWERAGTHTETGRYTAEQWLRINVDHLEAHAAQIESIRTSGGRRARRPRRRARLRRASWALSAALSSSSTPPERRGCARPGRRCRPRRATGAPRPGSGRLTRWSATPPTRR